MTYINSFNTQLSKGPDIVFTLASPHWSANLAKTDNRLTFA